jgi:S1-C subfamily serine protease
MMVCSASQTIMTDLRLRFSGRARMSIRRRVLMPSSGRSTMSGFNTGRPVCRGSSPITPPAATSGAYVGIAVESASDNGGATITAVSSGSPAADAGLKAGDTVTAVDGTKITSSLDLVRQVRAHSSGDTITVTYTRGGSSSDVKVKLASTPSAQSTS